MKKFQLIFLFFYLSNGSTQGQSKRYIELLEIAKGQAGLVLFSRPRKIKLERWNVKLYNERRRISLTDTLINDLINVTRGMDTTKWSTNEFNRTIVVDDKKITLNANKILNAWGVYDKTERKKYKRLINNWTNTDEQSRPINYLSRPILTSNEEYGLILTDLTSNGLCCGGEVTLYKYESGKWTGLGALYSWKY